MTHLVRILFKIFRGTWIRKIIQIIVCALESFSSDIYDSRPFPWFLN